MITAFTITISVTGKYHYMMLMVGKFDTRCNGKRPAMKAIEGIALYIMWKFCCLANAGYNRKLMRFHGHVDQGVLE
jgi:hypothetical protein